MKKLLLLLVAVITLTSCEEWWEEDEGMNWHVEIVEVRPSEWKRVDEGGDVYYECIKNFKDFTGLSRETMNFIYDEGTVQVYMFRDFDTDNETQTPLPYAVNWNNYYEETQMEIYYYNYTRNDIGFYFSSSGDAAGGRPDVAYFRVVMNW